MATRWRHRPTNHSEKDYSAKPSGSGTINSTFSYSPLGSLLALQGPGNNAIAIKTVNFDYTQDGSGYTQSEMIDRPIIATDVLGHTTLMRYDTRGNLTLAKDELGYQKNRYYNLADQLVKVEFPATGQTGSGQSYEQRIYMYVGGPLTAIKSFDESGNQVRQVNYLYGSEGESLAITGSAEPVSYSYDGSYRLKTLNDGNNQVTSYGYNAKGYLSSITYPGTGTVQYNTYNNAGQLTSMADGRGIVRNLTYSTIDGVLTDVQYPAFPGQNIHYDYDSYARVTGKSDGQGSQTLTYDDRDILTSKTTTYVGLSAKTVSRLYYPDGSVQSMSTPAGDFTYLYDKVGRLTSLLNPFGESTQWAYDNNDWLQSQSLSNGVIVTYVHNALGEMTQLANKLGNSILSQFTGMTFDGVGNLLSVTASVPAYPTLSGVTNYGYDNRNQITAEQSTKMGGISNAYSYDAAGNIITFRGQARNYNSNNQRIGTGYAYDGHGNPTTYSGLTASYDVNNCLTSLSNNFSAGYTAEALRAWKQGSSGRTYYLYDGNVPIIEMDASGAITAVNTFGRNGLVSRRLIAGNNSVFYTFDERGGTAQRLNSVGGLLSSRTTDAFGTPAGSGVTGDPYDGFGAQWGYYTDSETGLLLCTRRFYDPSAGRWLTRDPIRYSGGINLYGYVRNNPTGLIDPAGLEAIPEDPKRNRPCDAADCVKVRRWIDFVCHVLADTLGGCQGRNRDRTPVDSCEMLAIKTWIWFFCFALRASEIGMGCLPPDQIPGHITQMKQAGKAFIICYNTYVYWCHSDDDSDSSFVAMAMV